MKLNQKLKKIVALVLIVIMAVGIMPHNLWTTDTYAAVDIYSLKVGDVVDYGTVTDTISYRVEVSTINKNSSGEIRDIWYKGYILGSGEVPDYPDETKAIFRDYQYNINEVYVGDGITKLGDNCLWGKECGMILKKVVLPESLKTVGANVFRSAIGLMEMKFPSGLETVGEYAFENCGSGSYICDLPSSIKNYGKYAFSRMKFNEDITLPKGMGKEGTTVFSGCSGIENVIVPVDYDGGTGDTLTPFNAYSDTKNIFYQSGMTGNIFLQAYDCNSLQKVYIPASVNDLYISVGGSISYSIPTLMFECGTKLVDGVSTNYKGYKYSFYADENTRHNVDPKTGICSVCKLECEHKWNTAGICEKCSYECKHIWNGNTDSCEVCGMKLNHTHVWSDKWNSDETKHWKECAAQDNCVIENNPTIAAHEFSDYVVESIGTSTTPGVTVRTCKICGYRDELITTVPKPCGDSCYWSQIENIDGTITINITGSGDMYFGPNYTKAPWDSYSEKISQVNISDDITKIPYLAFANTSITSIKLPSKLKGIGDSAFVGTKLVEVEIPKNVAIGAFAFSGCEDLKKVVFGSGIANTGYWSFWGCKAIEEVTIHDSYPLYSDDMIDFSKVKKLYVQRGSSFMNTSAFMNLMMSDTCEVILFGCGHNNAEYVIDKEPTYFEKGEKHMVCPDCDEDFEKEEVPVIALDVTVGGLQKVADDMLIYFRNGIAQKSINGLQRYDGRFYITVNGVVDYKYNGLYDAGDGNIWYARNSLVDTAYVGIVRNAKGEFVPVKNGKVATTFTGLIKSDEKFYLSRNGIIDTSYTGIFEIDSNKWRIVGGRVDTDYVGMMNDGTGNFVPVFYGKVYEDFTGVIQNAGAYWYCVDGKLQTDYKGFVENAGIKWYVVYGKINTEFVGLGYEDGKWLAVYNGKHAPNTGIVRNAGSFWYVVDGILQDTYTGKVEYAGKFYNVKNGKVQ